MREDYRTPEEAYLLQMIREREAVRELLDAAAVSTDAHVKIMTLVLRELTEERG